jgi:lipoate-protein ligase A
VTATLRLVDTGLNGARRNVAVTAALAELHGQGRIPDTLRLHRYPVSVLLGRSQPLTAAQRAAAARHGAEIARRVTGGGAVAMGPGVLAWDLVVPRSTWPSLDAAAAAIGEALADALDLAATFRPPGDIVVGIRKVAGTSGLFDGPTLLHQGSLLVDADIAAMADLLGLPDLPVTSLAAHGAPAAPRIAEAIAAALGRPLQPAPLGEAELTLTARLLADEIGTEDFVAGEAALEPVP